MIDNFSILLSHGLLALAFWWLLSRDDLDREDAPVHEEDGSIVSTTRQKAGGRKDKSGWNSPDA